MSSVSSPEAQWSTVHPMDAKLHQILVIAMILAHLFIHLFSKHVPSPYSVIGKAGAWRYRSKIHILCLQRAHNLMGQVAKKKTLLPQMLRAVYKGSSLCYRDLENGNLAMMRARQAGKGIVKEEGGT